MDKAKPKTRGPWIHRFAIKFFTVVLTVLIFWLLGFVVNDIGSIPGPKYGDIEKRHLDKALVEKQKTLEKDIAEVTRQIDNLKEKQNILGDSTRSLQKTIGQLLELQKLSVQKNLTLSEPERKTFTESLNLFLSNQKRYQGINQDIAKLIEKQSSLQTEKRQIDRVLEQQRKSAREEYRKIHRKHNLNLAFLQLIVLVPLLLVAALLLIKKGGSIYFPIFLALGISTFVKVSIVIHKSFPNRFFKYGLILVFLAAVIKLLSYFIRSIAFPKTQWLIKQYREAYERFLCPVCGYPIRRGPMRFLFWTRRTASKLTLPKESPEEVSDYVCPSCGTKLFEECSSCHKIRHALLPFCEHCGAEKELREESSNQSINTSEK